MGYSIVQGTGDGVTTTFAINFALGYLKQSDVAFWVVGEVDGNGHPVYRTITWINSGLISISGVAPALGAAYQITRTVSKDTLVHVYANGEPIEEENLDDSNKQVMMAVQEVLDGRFNAPLHADLDMSFNKIINLADGTASHDAVNLEQLNALEAALVAASVNPSGDSNIILSDITTGNATTAKHGFLPKLDGVSTHFLNGLGDWADVASVITLPYLQGTGTATGDATSLAFGNADASGVSSISIGDGAVASGADGNAIGNGSLASGADSVANGSGAGALADKAVAVGNGALASGTQSVNVGSQSSGTLGARANNAICIGRDNHATAIKSILIGDAALDNGHAQSIVLGDNQAVAAANETVIGYGTNNIHLFNDGTFKTPLSDNDPDKYLGADGDFHTLSVGTGAFATLLVNTSTTTILSSNNVASVTYSSGTFQINFTVAASNIHYVITSQNDVGSSTPNVLNRNTGSVQINYGSTGGVWNVVIYQ